MKLKMNQAATKIQSMRRRVVSRRRMIKEKVMKRLRHDQSVRTNFMINIVRTLYVIFWLLPVTSLLLLFLSLLLSVAFSLSLSLSFSLSLYLSLSLCLSVPLSFYFSHQVSISLPFFSDVSVFLHLHYHLLSLPYSITDSMSNPIENLSKQLIWTT